MCTVHIAKISASRSQCLWWCKSQSAEQAQDYLTWSGRKTILSWKIPNQHKYFSRISRNCKWTTAHKADLSVTQQFNHQILNHAGVHFEDRFRDLFPASHYRISNVSYTRLNRKKSAGIRRFYFACKAKLATFLPILSVTSSVRVKSSTSIIAIEFPTTKIFRIHLDVRHSHTVG